MNDLINRQDAIDALGERPMVWTDDDQYALGERNQYDIDRLVVETLPSSQPEIVRCKDCKWKQGSECVRFSDVRPFPDDFCSRAERRTT